jgi:hypothetical protein
LLENQTSVETIVEELIKEVKANDARHAAERDILIQKYLDI